MVAGEIEIILDLCTAKKEQQGRLKLLRDLAYQRVNGADQETVRSIYPTILRRIEVGGASYGPPTLIVFRDKS